MKNTAKQSSPPLEPRVAVRHQPRERLLHRARRRRDRLPLPQLVAPPRLAGEVVPPADGPVVEFARRHALLEAPARALVRLELELHLRLGVVPVSFVNKTH